ncbi:MAG: helix-turn-helix domain-containing protein [Microgenomates group bacterium]|nr:helix-turn-helix domain-containing protein [Microgenomates group bacterium]
MTCPKTIWEYSRMTEAERIIQTAYHIKSGFYQKKGFFVLPYNIKKNPKIIYFPELKFNQIDAFWDNPDINTVASKLPKLTINYQSSFNLWSTIEAHFWVMVNKQFPKMFAEIKKVIIRPTEFGSICTANSTWQKNDNKTIVIYLRIDADYSHIAEAIFIDRLWRIKSYDNYSWEEKESIIDFIIKNTELNKLFPNYKKTLQAVRQKQQALWAKDSDNYLQSLGFNLGKKVFSIENNDIYIKNKKMAIKGYEKMVLSLLINKRNTVVSFDEIADSIWKNNPGEKFSLYAITKLIQRIREKIKFYNILPEILQTQKKQGYMLVDNVVL